MNNDNMLPTPVQHANNRMALMGSDSANIDAMIARINPPVHPHIRTKPVTTVGSCGKVSSLAKFSPIGTMGIIKAPAMKTFAYISE